MSNANQNPQNTEYWLNAIRADGRGVIFATKGKKEAGDLINKEEFFDNHADAIAKITPFIDAEFNVFILVGNMLPDAINRQSKNISEFSSLFIDLDCGPEKPYATQEDAARALTAFISDNNFPKPSIVVDSGRGIHAYWSFNKPLTKDEWLPLAQPFKKHLLNASLQIDPVVTADCARVMRVPGTYNHKTKDDPKPVNVLFPKNFAPITRYSVSDIQRAIDVIAPPPINYAAHQPHPLQNLTINDASAYLIALSCKQVQTILGNGGSNRSEPEWRADLGLLKFTIEEPVILHTASNGHPGYSASETNTKAARWTASPTTCKHYYEHLASPLCEDCQYKGRLTSPIQLGYPTPRGLNSDHDAALKNLPTATTNTQAPAYLNAPDEILAVSKQFAWDREAMNIFNIRTGRYVQKDRFSTHYANKFIDLGTAQKPKPVPLGQAWIQHHLRREATCILMAPNQPEDLPDGAINSWLGFDVEPTPGDIKPFIKLFKRQIPNKQDRKYVLYWMANLFQNPAGRAFTSIVMWSRVQGTGKNLMWECIGNLFNDRHYTLVSQEVFDDSFTEWKANRVFVICDEVSSTEKRTTADRIKGWITSSSNAINTKNEPKFTQPNLIKYVFLSNHPDAVFLDDNDRRFFVVEVSQGRLPEQNAQEFVRWRDGGGREALLYFLLNLDISNFNPMAPAPMSSAKQEMIEDNKSDFERWFENILNNINQTIGREICSAEEISSQYKTTMGSNCSSRTVTLHLKKLGIKRLSKQAKLPTGKRVRIYALASLRTYEAMTDKELGDIISAKLFWTA